MKKVLLLIILLSISAVSVCASVIKYISTDGKIIVPNNEFYDSNGLLLTIKSNTYDEGMGLIEFDGDITVVGEKAFYNKTTLAMVILPEGIVKIGDRSFLGCYNMKVIKFPKSLYQIGKYSFENTSMLHTIISNSHRMPSFSKYTFHGSGSGVIYHPKDVDYSDWFKNEYLKKWKESVIETENERNNAILVLDGTESNYLALTNSDSWVTMKIGNTTISNFKDIGVLNFDNVKSTLHTIICDIKESQNYNFATIKTPVTIIEYTTTDNQPIKFYTSNVFNNRDETIIGNYKSIYSNGRGLIICPDTLAHIGDGVFFNRSTLKSITFPNSLKRISASNNNSCFHGCSNLKVIYCNAEICPSSSSTTFRGIASNGIVYYPQGSDYSYWKRNTSYYLGYYGWDFQPLDMFSDIETIIEHPHTNIISIFNIKGESIETLQRGINIIKYLDGSTKKIIKK